MLNSVAQSLNATTSLLKSLASKYAAYGVPIAFACIVIATLMVAHHEDHAITLDSIMAAQKNNFALWVLDFMPFIFTLWGQYVSSIIAFQAGVEIIDQTSDLRAQTVVLEEKAFPPGYCLIRNSRILLSVCWLRMGWTRPKSCLKLPKPLSWWTRNGRWKFCAG